MLGPPPVAGPTGPPVFRGRPLLGHWREFRRDPLGLLVRAGRAHPDLVSVPLAHERLYLLGDPEGIRHVLVTNWRAYGRGRAHRVLARFLGPGLLTSDGDDWVTCRRSAQQGLGSRHLAACREAIAAEVARRLERWHALAAAGPVSLASLLMSLTTQVTARVLFSRDLDDRAADQFVDDFQTVQVHAYRQLETPLRLPSRRAGAALARIRALAARLATGAPACIAPQALTLLVAAPENPSNTLAWALFLLGNHPEVQRRLKAELALGPLGDEYLHMVIDETLRLYPGAWSFGRTALQDDVLAGHRVPAGAEIVISPYVLHRDPAHWRDPDRFDPERFAPARREEIGAYRYLPFSAGPRRCIGDELTAAVVPVVLREILGRFDIQLAPGEVGACRPLFTLRPRSGIQALLSPVRVRTAA
jgi:enediyne biosynthesis protein E7